MKFNVLVFCRLVFLSLSISDTDVAFFSQTLSKTKDRILCAIQSMEKKERNTPKNEDGVVKNAKASKKKRIKNKETNDVQKKMVFISDGLW